jgi:opacity protein-like surface antigen
MRTCAFAVLLVLFCSTFAAAQIEEELFEVPNTELYGGYAYQHAGLDGSLTATQGLVNKDTANLQGFTIGFSHYFWKNLGVAVDVSRVTKSSLDATGIKYTRSNYVGGPTFRLRRFGFFSPSVHVMAGVDRATFEVPSAGTVLKFRDTDFAILGGGTLDGNLSRHLAVRLVQLDYLHTRHYGTSQSAIRYTGGIVVRF